MTHSARRSTYFAFQGLLMAVLVLLFVHRAHDAAGWGARLALLVATTGGTLAAVRLTPERVLLTGAFQIGLFLADAALASLTLYWTASTDFYLLYFLIIFGTALTRDLGRSLLAALVTSLLFLYTAWAQRSAFPTDTGFWLRFLMLWTSAPLLAILSRDTEHARLEQDRKYRERLVQLGRLAALGELAGEVAHRIKGPLTTIMVNSDVLAHRHARSAETVRELGEIREEAARCKEILKTLLDLGRIEEMDLSPLDLGEPVRLAIKALEPQVRAADLRLEVRGLDAPMLVRGDHGLLQEAVAAVLQNAVEASRVGRGSIRVAASRARARGARHFELTIEDDGCGIDPEDLERVFTPFFTTKAPEGTGLGLSAALRILEKHGGTIEAHSEGRSRGARFRLLVPSEERA